ncbi:hypothetical protein BGZ88_012153, partial [Linnemannia elongata]
MSPSVGVDELSNAVGYHDGETGTRYYIPSDTLEALTFGKLLTAHEKEAFARGNCSYTLTYDGDKNLKSVQKGPMWGKNRYPTLNKTATSTSATAISSPITTN